MEPELRPMRLWNLWRKNEAMKLRHATEKLREYQQYLAGLCDRFFLYFYLANNIRFKALARASLALRIRFGLKGLPITNLADWNAGLKHCKRKGQVILVCAGKKNMALQRKACENLQRIFSEKNFIIVLATPVEDFSFYARLGWLVEYLPRMGNFLSFYRSKKIWYLTLRYKDAVILPIEYGLENEASIYKLLSRQMNIYESKESRI